MALGGLRQGVTPLDMAHAYETFATGGKLVYGTLSPGQSEQEPARARDRSGSSASTSATARRTRAVVLDDGQRMVNKKQDAQGAQARDRRHRLLDPADRGQERHRDPRAQIPGVMVAGKTGTTENYGDAWFVGWTKEYTVAVWVGYPDEFKPMKTEFQGEPVAGGTYPAGIWKTFMQALLKIDPLPKKDGGDGTGKPIETPTPGAGTVRARRRPRSRRPPRPPRRRPTGDGGTGGTTPRRSGRRRRPIRPPRTRPATDRRPPIRRRPIPGRRDRRCGRDRTALPATALRARLAGGR